MVWEGGFWGGGEGRTRKIALVIGNGAYDNVSDLPNAAVDAANVARTLRRELGFTVIYRLDVTSEELADLAEVFLAELDGAPGQADRADTALLYYAGHGLELNGKNYIVPRDYLRPDAEQGALYPVQDLMRRMTKKADNNLVFLDACRDRGGIEPSLVKTPHAVAPTGGLAKMQLDDDLTFVAFAADPGDVALDGPAGQGSYFSNAVCRNILAQGADVHTVLQRVANEVRTRTSGRQRPWSYSNMCEPFTLKPAPWLPVILLGALGLLCGLVNGFTSFQWTGAPVHVWVNPLPLFGAALFGVALAAGVKLFGRGYWRDAALAFVFYVGVAITCRLWIGSYAEAFPLFQNATVEDLHNDSAIREILLILLLSSAAVGYASVKAGALTSKALDPIYWATGGIVIGAVAFVVGVFFIRYGPDLSEGLRFVLICIAVGLWQMALGIHVGRAYSLYSGPPEKPG